MLARAGHTRQFITCKLTEAIWLSYVAYVSFFTLSLQTIINDFDDVQFWAVLLLFRHRDVGSVVALFVSRSCLFWIL
jgi:hypothetical protein